MIKPVPNGIMNRVYLMHLNCIFVIVQRVALRQGPEVVLGQANPGGRQVGCR
jgi:hypothetical protein